MEEASPLLLNSGAVQKSKWKLFAEETKKVGYIAAPMVVVTVSQHLSRVASMMMVGHLGELALSGAAVATSFTNVSGLSLLTQSLILPMVLSSIAALSFHVPVCWVLVFKANLGIAGAALAIGLSYWLNVVLLALYVKYSSTCERTRAAWSRDVLPSVREFFCFAVPSAVMVCLEWWSFEIVVLLSGLLPNPQLETSVLSICLLVASSHYFIPYSIGAAASTRVSNELGAGCPDRARASTWSAMVLSLSEAVISCSILLSFRHVLGYAFSNEKEVVNYLQEISPFVCLLLFMDCIQAVLSVLGVARGSGWQHLGAYVNLGAYYLAGLPTAAVLGFALRLRGKGLWFGLNVGSIVQSILLSLLACFTNWKRQALSARERMAECGRK
ncbi:protein DETOXIFICATION 14-like isoform X5 [Primulina huaijiensis]|uniref:protein DETOXIFICATION 14-like isoform X5 n=1 Tax=Primulina huaijiensis TaxID=1492673 RepID=UPI003CC75DA0